MKHLKEETIIVVMGLANTCYPSDEGQEEWVDPLGAKETERASKPWPERERLEKYMDDLGNDEKSELMALMWLGRDGGQWACLVDQARGQLADAARYMAEKAPLAIYLKKGIERARGIGLL